LVGLGTSQSISDTKVSQSTSCHQASVTEDSQLCICYTDSGIAWAEACIEARGRTMLNAKAR